MNIIFYILNIFLILLQFQRKKAFNEQLGESLLYVSNINVNDLSDEINMLENIFEVKYFARALTALSNDIFRQG